jgi:hypothetical protein
MPEISEIYHRKEQASRHRRGVHAKRAERRRENEASDDDEDKRSGHRGGMQAISRQAKSKEGMDAREASTEERWKECGSRGKCEERAQYREAIN